MKKNLVIKNTLVTLYALIIFAVLSMVIMSGITRRQSKDSIIRIAEVYRQNLLYEHGGYDSFVTLSDEAKKSMRVTVIAMDGTVLADSMIEPNGFDNHIERPEIVSAIEGNPKVSIRQSGTFNTEMMYYAFVAEDTFIGGEIIVRVAMITSSLSAYILSAIPIIVLLLVAVALLSIAFTLPLNRSILRAFKVVELNLNRINKGTYQMVMPTFKHPEINRAVIGLNDIQEKIKENIDNLSRQSKKLDFVLENTEQGIIALDKNLNIILINTYAKKVFAVTGDIYGKNLLYSGCGKSFFDSVQSNIMGENKSFELSQSGKTYQVKTNLSGDNDIAAIVLISDITELKKTDSLRSDFFANASHELKTPLTSIMGFSELLEKEEDLERIKKYTSYIIRDNKRMLGLIDDMLKLSRLDSKADFGQKTRLKIENVAADAVESLKILAAEKRVSVKINGAAVINAVYENIYELLQNLISNAIRYNITGGKVQVDIENTGGRARITVADSGIGIDDTHKARIFERFYRVDKGRSKQVGGTGLGLSIVKHIVNLYGGNIELESEVGKGTKITVII